MEFRFKSQEDMWKLASVLFMARVEARDMKAEEEHNLKVTIKQISNGAKHA